MAKMLSAAQERFLRNARDCKPAHMPPCGDRAAGRRASAYWRTAETLQRAGLVTRYGSGFVLTSAGCMLVAKLATRPESEEE